MKTLCRIGAAIALLAGPPLVGKTDARGAAHREFAAVPDSTVEAYATRFGAPPRLAALIHAEVLRQGLPPGIVFAVVEAESGFDPGAVGRQGEIGLMQIKPSVARAYGRIDAAALARGWVPTTGYARRVLDCCGTDC
ncbi:MAG TPA: transglycosylase SLT domain-containing protein [Gemmatimonadota bacterium]|nr:transglycosylase SLT domain-containing protein [Gemmatimonadota bacterium]